MEWKGKPISELTNKELFEAVKEQGQISQEASNRYFANLDVAYRLGAGDQMLRNHEDWRPHMELLGALTAEARKRGPILDISE